jgi:ABC-type glycerol-3-phosphate transport system permease component
MALLPAADLAPFRPVAPDVRTSSSEGVREGSATRRLPRVGTVIGHVVLIIVAAVSIFPIYWMFATAFRQPVDATAQSPFPWPMSLQNFVTVWHDIPILGMIGNTFLMALAVAVCQLIIAVLAAYGFAMWQFPGRNLLFVLFIGSWLVPFQVTMIPNYVLISQMGLLGSIAGVIVPTLCSAFAVMLMRQHMQSFPRELIDAAHMDGRNNWGILVRVVLPNMRPALAALGIMLFIEAWNNYLWPSLIFQHQSDALIQVGIRSFLGAEGDNWGAIMAASGLACLPIFLIYLILQRHIVDAFVRSGLR